MSECVLCGDYRSEHRPDCRVRNYYGPGRNDYTICGCPGYEAHADECEEAPGAA